MTNSETLDRNTAPVTTGYSESSSELDGESFSSFDGDLAEPSFEADAVIRNDYCPLNEW